MSDQLMRNIMQNKSFNMQQKMTYFLMFSNPSQLPHNPTYTDYSEIGKQIKHLVKQNVITLHGFNKKFELQYNENIG